MKLYNDKIECVGCEACKNICPTNCITMIYDNEGFLYPDVDIEKCISCGRCKSVCQEIGHNKREEFETLQVYAVKNKNESCRYQSSSGGFFYEIANWVIKNKGIVYGAAFDKQFSVKHIGIETVDDIKYLMGSKYVQSSIGNTYIDAENELKKERWVLYTGTPCQIDGLNAYLERKYDKLISLSVICHGVPSPKVWERYLQLKKGQYFENNILGVNFRDKTNGWKHFGLKIQFDNAEYEMSHKMDLYMQGFLQDLYLRRSCYECPSKGVSLSSDFLLGDFWGIDNVLESFNDDCGVSAVIINTDKATVLWENIKDQFIYKKVRYTDVLKYNSALEKSIKMNLKRERFFIELQETSLVEESIRNNLVETTIQDESRGKYQYPIIYKYLEQIISQKGICNVLRRLQKVNIILYAITDITDLVIKEIQNNNEISLCAICDKNHSAYNGFYRNVKVVSIDEMQLMMEEKEFLIIICNPMRENQIFDDLLNRGFSLEDIVSVTSLIFD